MTDVPKRVYLDETSLDEDGFYVCEAEKRHLNMDQEFVRADVRGIDVYILTMKLSGDRKEHFVRITCDGRSIDIRKYSDDFLNRAEYERDMLRHVLLGEPKPNLMDSKYADKEVAV